jgi:ABC-type branched-subunit amino acid transport system ATPase component
MDETCAVYVRGLRKGYGGRTVVDGVDLDVTAGQIVGLVGSNGAGKTTTVECVQGLRRPDAGMLRVIVGSTAAVTARPGPGVPRRRVRVRARTAVNFSDRQGTATRVTNCCCWLAGFVPSLYVVTEVV